MQQPAFFHVLSFNYSRKREDNIFWGRLKAQHCNASSLDLAKIHTFRILHYKAAESSNEFYIYS